MTIGDPGTGGGRDGGFGSRFPLGSTGKAILVLMLLFGLTIAYLLYNGQPLQ